MSRPYGWWDTPTAQDLDYLTDLYAAMAEGQQVGEDVAAQMLAFHAEGQPCPICGRRVGDHSRRELRRCDNTRPDLEIVR